MTAMLLVIAPGLSTTVQDEGRFGWQRFGVPVSGALDPVALAAANVVVGNPPDEAGLECLFQGPTLEVTADSVRLAVSGEGGALDVVGGHPRRVPPLESVTLERGERFRVVIAGPSISAYLAIAGGLVLAPVLGSRSTYARARLGGFEGRALRVGDRLELGRAGAPGGAEQRLAGVDLAPAGTIDVVPGPQWDRFTERAHATLAAASYTVQPASDRMGLRLAGERLEHVRGADIVSDAIPPGAIQVPGDGRPIIMLADRQTTGGYTKIATVASADLPALGRIGPGAVVRFRIVTVAAAEARRRALEVTMAGWPAALRPVGADLDAAGLLSSNLVSGVIDATGDQVED